MHILDGDEVLSEEEEEQVRKILSFVVVGGGPTGTELVGELSDFLKYCDLLILLELLCSGWWRGLLERDWSEN